DTVYVMWAGDGNGDGQVTAPDFNLWNAATTAGQTGYRPSDYNMDAQVTAPDFNLWNANTTAGAATGFSDQLADLLIPRTGGGGAQELQTLTTGAGSVVRLVVTRNTGQDFWLDVEARADSSALTANTLASAVVDVFYDHTELTLASTDRGVLQSGTYLNSVQQLDKDGDRFIRITHRASSGGSPWHDLDTDWEVIHKLYFDRSPPKQDDGTSIRPRTVTIGFYDSHANSNGSKWVNETIPVIQ
ncbi:MAG TPA: hypothetical protein VGA66_12035, partial [Mycobacterium sp.]